MKGGVDWWGGRRWVSRRYVGGFYRKFGRCLVGIGFFNLEKLVLF